MNEQWEYGQEKELEQKVSAYEDVIIETVKEISKIQEDKKYRRMLIRKRISIQKKDKEGRKDFMRWLKRIFFGKRSQVKALVDFDDLEPVRINLIRKAKVLKYSSNDTLPGYYGRKSGKRVFIFAGVPMYDVGGGQRFAQLAKTFNSMGFDVYYICAFPVEEEKQLEIRIPVTGHHGANEIDEEWFEKTAEEDSLVIFELPYAGFEKYLDTALKKGCHTVYEHVDNWDTSLGAKFYDETVLKHYLEKAEKIVVTARNLEEKLKEHTDREILYLPNAVNIEIFDDSLTYEKPKDLVCGKKTFLYFGSLWGEWFDWEKVEYLADKCPEYQINLIGDYHGCMKYVEKKIKNIHFLGEKLQTELPSYLAYSDVALLPFKTCEIGKYVSPLKVFEYIAMDVPVLSTKLEDIAGYPNVFCSDDKDEWVSYAGKMQKKDDNREFLADNNWFARCRELLSGTKYSEKVSAGISVIVLNYNNKDVIGKCVDSLIRYKKRYDYEVIVVDNGSTDGSFEMLEEMYQEEIRLIKNKKNGCSSGRNLGVSYAKGEILCFLDSDQWALHEYWMDSALELIERDENIGAAGWCAGWFGLKTIAGAVVDELDDRGMKYPSAAYRRDVAYLGTGGMIMKKSLFEEIDGFDEFYDPTCYEDTDLSLKIRNAGKEIVYCPYIGLKHKPHQTTNAGSKEHQELMERNGNYFEEKWKKTNYKLLEYYLW